MKVLSIQKTQTNTYAPKAHSHNPPNQVTFSAKRLPSGEYSDWLVEWVAKDLPNAWDNMIEHLHNFRAESYKLFILGDRLEKTRNTVQSWVLRRNSDFKNVINDLKAGGKPVDIGKARYEASDLIETYSSKQDYINRSDKVEKDSWWKILISTSPDEEP